MKKTINGKKITILNDSRVTFWGKILRRLKIDELPQLFNIIKGEMRFIGPRPEVEEFIDKNSFSFLRSIKPGLSDYASILFRNEEKILDNSDLENPYLEILKIKVSLAKYYEVRKSFSEDFKLVILTIVSIITPSISEEYLKKHILNQEQLKYFKKI